MKFVQRSDAWYLLGFFVTIISIGTILLLLPFSWKGYQSMPELSWIDALFTATSAVCVTGLNSVDITGFTTIGKIIIVCLIQFGGLGIISFTSLLLMIPGKRLPVRRLTTIRSFFVEGVEYEPRRIVLSIVFTTFLIELFGTLSLSYFFKQAGVQDWFFCGLFHAISAFCNAGFSLFSNNLEGYVYNVPVIVIIMLLIVTGGLGFIVLQDIANVLQKKKRYLTYHSRVVLAMTALLIIPGTVFFLLVERTRAYKDLPFGLAVIQAMFQTITPRTAGFDSIAQNLLSQPSKILTILYMFIGAAPGSIAGGIKVTTAFVVGSVMLRRPDKNGDIRFRHHRLVAETINNGIVFFLKALLLLLSSAMALSIIEGLHGQDFDSIVFEVVSAFGTVGLSLGLTPQLSVMGKLIIIATMFAGRVGLVALAFPGPYKKEYPINYPEGKVLLG